MGLNFDILRIVRLRYVIAVAIMTIGAAYFATTVFFQTGKIGQANEFLRSKEQLIFTAGAIADSAARLENINANSRLGGQFKRAISAHAEVLEKRIVNLRDHFQELSPKLRSEVTSGSSYTSDIVSLSGGYLKVAREMIRTGDLVPESKKVVKYNSILLTPALSEIANIIRSNIQTQILNVKSTVHIMSSAVALVAILLIAMVFLPMERAIKKMMADLANATERAKAADRAKSEFLANMSHEIRTPMNGVMGMAELLAQSELNRKQAMFTDVIVKSGQALLTIINDILDFSKLESGQMELDPTEFDLAEAIEDVATLVSAKVAEKDIELIVRVAPNLPHQYMGDVGRIRQVITNLMGNAVKFTEEGHVLVDVAPLTGATPGLQRLKISVEDTGVGIPKDDLKKVFEKFSQSDSSATRKHEGTGLGLSISTALVQLMNGQIGVESELGTGSTFWFTIDLPPVNAEKKQIIPRDVSGSRILIVDDNEVNCKIFEEQFRNWKFDCVATKGVNEALAFIRQASQLNVGIDCVVLDYQMPGLNGGDFMQRMREAKDIVDIPVIMLTSVDQTEDGQAFSSLGLHGHLTKPARASTLLETIVDVLQSVHTEWEGQVSSNLETAKSRPRGQIGTKCTADNKDNNMQPTVIETNTVPQQVHNVPRISKSGSSDIDVLVCEDNSVNQIVIGQILEDLGVRFKIAGNGREGVALRNHLNPKIILMDVSMPVMNGFDATREIRKIDEVQGVYTPIIGVTAHAIKGDMEKCMDAGMDDYLSKPVSPKMLTKKVQAHLNWSTPLVGSA